MKIYQHTVHYYETDKMGIVHHSNYVRWMEEARVDFLAQIGWDFVKLEANGVISPVIAVACEYKNSSRFADVISIAVAIEECGGVRLKLKYTMTNAQGVLICEARSEHCFMTPQGKLLRLKKDLPGFYQALQESQTSQPLLSSNQN